jgi:type III pantothenate kinase
MELLVDIGNTSLKWAPRESGEVRGMSCVRHHGALPMDLLASWEQLPEPGRVLVASVAAQPVTDALLRVCRSRWGLDAGLVRVDPSRGGVELAYTEPSRLGVDRWLALIAARRCCAAPALIVDAGTAITYDLLLADGHHLGGLIVPGIAMMRDGLLAGTGIPPVEPVDAELSWGADTGAAIGIGTLQAPAALAERLRRRLAEASGQPPALLLTGGDAHRLRPALEGPVRTEPDLVLQGLALLID